MSEEEGGGAEGRETQREPSLGRVRLLVTLKCLTFLFSHENFTYEKVFDMKINNKHTRHIMFAIFPSAEKSSKT